MPGSITSANAIVALSVSSIFPSPSILHGFSADNIFGADDQELAQTSMGVDGRLSGGFVFEPVRWSIYFQADSESIALFDQWNLLQRQQREVFQASATVTLRSIGSKWNMNRGFLTTFKPMPDAQKTLQPRRFLITWESVLPAAV